MKRNNSVSVGLKGERVDEHSKSAFIKKVHYYYNLCIGFFDRFSTIGQLF